MPNNPMLPIPVPKSSVELLKPDDNAKFKDMLTAFDGLMKQALADENYQYQTELRTMEKEKRDNEIANLNMVYDRLEQTWGKDALAQYRNIGTKPDVAESYLKQDFTSNILQEFSRRQNTDNPMTTAELTQYSDRMDSNVFKNLVGINEAPIQAAKEQGFLEWLNSGNNVYSGTDTINSVASQMGLDSKWAFDEQQRLRLLKAAEATANNRGGSGNNGGNNGGNDGGDGGDSGRTPTWDAGAIPGIVAIADIILEPGFMNDVNLSDPMLNEAEANLSSSLNKLQEASGNVAAWLKTGQGKPNFKAGYSAGELIIGDGNSRVRVKSDGTVWKFKKAEDGKITWTKVKKPEDFTTKELRIGREIAADYNDVTNWLSEYKTFKSNAEAYVRVLRNSKKRNYQSIYE